MSRKLLLRVMDDQKIPEGIRLVPIFEEDYKYLKKLPRGEAVAFTTTNNRRAVTLSKLWVLMTFTIANLPEKFDELAGKPVDYFYQWLKLKIGFVDRFKVEGVERESVRSGSFDECPDEIVFMECLYEPSVTVMAWMLGYGTVQELEDASREWQTVKNT